MNLKPEVVPMAVIERVITLKVLMIDDEFTDQSASGRASRALAQELENKGIVVYEATSADDGQAVILSDPSLDSICSTGR